MCHAVWIPSGGEGAINAKMQENSDYVNLKEMNSVVVCFMP